MPQPGPARPADRRLIVPFGRLPGLALAGWALIALFVALAIPVDLQLTMPVDLAVTRAIQPFAGSLLDVGFSLITALGSAEVTTLVALAVALLLAKRSGWREAWPPLVMFLMVPVEVASKLLVRQTPVEAYFQHLSLSFGVDVHLPYGYPSGHALRSIFLYGLLAYLAPRLIRSRAAGRLARWAIVCLVLLLAASRLYVGVHWFTGIVGGLLLGGGSLLLTLATMAASSASAAPARPRISALVAPSD